MHLSWELSHFSVLSKTCFCWTLTLLYQRGMISQPTETNVIIKMWVWKGPGSTVELQQSILRPWERRWPCTCKLSLRCLGKRHWLAVWLRMCVTAKINQMLQIWAAFRMILFYLSLWRLSSLAWFFSDTWEEGTERWRKRWPRKFARN